MRDVLRLPWQIDIIRFVDEVPLDGVDDLMSVLRVLLTPLSHQELVQLGVGDVTPVGRQLGVVDSVELIVDLGEGRDGRDRQLLELPRDVVVTHFPNSSGFGSTEMPMQLRLSTTRSSYFHLGRAEARPVVSGVVKPCWPGDDGADPWGHVDAARPDGHLAGRDGDPEHSRALRSAR
jgi:hypothetical protein